MKKGWQTKRLAEVCEIVNGGTPKTGVPAYWGGKNLWITPAEMGGRVTPYIDDTVRKITDLGLNDSSARMLPVHSVILSTRAPIGYLTINTRPMSTNQGCKGLIPNKQLQYKYLYYYLVSITDLLNSLGSGATFKELSGSKLKEVPIFLTSLSEQKRIVAILDEAFAGLATAQANAEKNLENARSIFESQLRSIFSHRGKELRVTSLESRAAQPHGLQKRIANDGDEAAIAQLNSGYITKTGGREATLRHIPGKLSLAVGAPHTGARSGWSWSALTDLARLESGHTPSRRHPEYWGGKIPWLGIQDARENHGKRIMDTIQKTNELGIANSSARVLPKDTVCLSRTASVGYVVVMGRPMATSQDFVNWVCSAALYPDFLKYLLLAEGREGLLRYASGSVHQTIYFPEAKAFYICHPEIVEQKRISGLCDDLAVETQKLDMLYKRKMSKLVELKKALLHHAFAGEL